MTFIADGGCYNSSRIALDGTSSGVARNWQAASGTDVTGWDHANIAIYASSFDADDMNSTTIAFKLQWREVGSGTWLNLASTGAVKWGTSTTLTQGNAVTSTEGSGDFNCGGMTNLFGSNGDEVEGTNQSASRQRVKKEGFDIQWALDFSDAASLTEYEFRVLDSDNEVCSSSPSETTITTQFLAVNPIITDVDGDESIGVTQTNVVLTGSTLTTNTGQAKVEISPNNTYAGGGLVQQTIDSWADTSIQFDVVRTGLSVGTNYIWVTNDGGNQNETAFPITLVGNTPTITNVDGDNSLLVGQTNIVIAGNNFESAQGTGKVEISPNATYGAGGLVLQSIDTWSNTSVQFDLDRTGLSVGTLYVYVTNNDGVVSAGQSITLVAVNPTVSSFNGGTQIFGDTTGIAVTGFDFGAVDAGLAKVELGNSATYAGSTLKVEQTVTTWGGATSITVNAVRGGLSTGTVYAYVTNSDGGVNTNGLAVTLSSVTPAVAGLDGDGGNQNSSITAGETVIMTGSDFRPNQSTGKVEVCNNVNYASATVKNTQTITAWADTQISFTVDNVTGLVEGTNYVFVTNGTGEFS